MYTYRRVFSLAARTSRFIRPDSFAIPALAIDIAAPRNPVLDRFPALERSSRDIGTDRRSRKLNGKYVAATRTMLARLRISAGD